ncbi:sugar phosphate isomerase/epimerase family protein [Novosphingobium sp.]|uniref:sugar phosphate isomerase/epimerase family protein n=1 Tax=Novosphingobium sp. TaxID=1874826 RepID=UPI0038B8A986
MGRHHPLAMASGIMPDATPVQLVEAAAAAGFALGGMWFEPATWTDATTRAVGRALAATGVQLLDIEVVWIKPGPLDPDHVRLVEVGAELGARNVLCVSSDPDAGATRDKLAALAEVGERAGIRINLEFGLFTEVRTIHAASAILRQIASPAIGLLVDSLHWQRSGGTIADIAAIPPAWLSYAQLCDAPLDFAHLDDPQAIITEAIDGRLPLGHGQLPLRAIIEALPDGLPIAIEERSKALRDGWPDLHDRARRLMETSRAFMDALSV